MIIYLQIALFPKYTNTHADRHRAPWSQKERKKAEVNVTTLPNCFGAESIGFWDVAPEGITEPRAVTEEVPKIPAAQHP